MRVGSVLNFDNNGKRALQGIAAVSGSRHPREATSITGKQWKSRAIRSNDEVKIFLPPKAMDQFVVRKLTGENARNQEAVANPGSNPLLRPRGWAKLPFLSLPGGRDLRSPSCFQLGGSDFT